MDHARRSPSSSDSCEDLPDLIDPEDIDKYPLTLKSCTWELAADSLAADQVAYARTRMSNASTPTMLLSEIREYIRQKYPGFERTPKWKEHLRQSLPVYSKILIKSKL